MVGNSKSWISIVWTIDRAQASRRSSDICATAFRYCRPTRSWARWICPLMGFHIKSWWWKNHWICRKARLCRRLGWEGLSTLNGIGTIWVNPKGLCVFTRVWAVLLFFLQNLDLCMDGDVSRSVVGFPTRVVLRFFLQNVGCTSSFMEGGVSSSVVVFSFLVFLQCVLGGTSSWTKSGGSSCNNSLRSSSPSNVFPCIESSQWRASICSSGASVS